MVSYTAIAGLVGIVAFTGFQQFNKATLTAAESRTGLVSQLGGELSMSGNLASAIAAQSVTSFASSLTNGSAALEALAFTPFGIPGMKGRRSETGDENRTLFTEEGQEEEHSGSCGGGFCTGSKGGCFVAGTEVATPHGLVAIETIRPEDTVLTRNPDSGEFGVGRVLRTYVRVGAPVIHVRGIGAGQTPFDIQSTRGHLYWTAHGWTRADHLENGDGLLDDVDGPVAVSTIQAVSDTATVYNLEVEGTHSYFVGKDAVWVNDMGPGEPTVEQ